MEETKAYEYTKVELVKIAYMATIIARRQMNAISNAVSGSYRPGSHGGVLPKKLYHTRKSHAAEDFFALKKNKPRKPKYIKMFDVLLKAQRNYQQAQENFEIMARSLSPEEQNEIMGGFALPVNVTADK